MEDGKGEQNRMPVVLFGNGINLATSTPSWRSLVFNLTLLIDDQDLRNELLNVTEGSLSLLMEILVSKANIGETEVRRHIAQFFSGLPSIIHRKLSKRSDIVHILTTNYDRNIENALK